MELFSFWSVCMSIVFDLRLFSICIVVALII